MAILFTALMLFSVSADASVFGLGRVWRAPNAQVKGGSIILILPVDSITTKSHDNTRVSPEILYTDSAMKFAANSFIAGYAKQKISCKPVSLVADSANPKPSFTWSAFSKAPPDSSVVAFVKKAAASAKADYVIIPCDVTLRQTTYQMEAWRDSPSYQHPVEFSASVVIRMQIWDKSGALLFERESRGNSGKPVLYDKVKKRQKLDDDLERQAKKYFAPPPLKALFKASKLLFNI